MKLLVDACISGFAVNFLREKGHDLVWIPEEGTDPGDSEILKRAFEENRILITADKDFGDLVFVFRKPHPAIIRLVNIRAREQGERIWMALKRYGELFDQNPILTVDKTRIRIKYPSEPQ